MPTIDKPLSELKEYMGITPCPDDFDEFWDKRLARLNAIVPEVTFEDAPLKVKGAIIQKMTFIAEDGSKIVSRVVRPDTTEKVPVMFRFHGLSGNSSDYCSNLAYAYAGFAVITMDCRNQGGESNDNTPRSAINTSWITRGYFEGPENLYYTAIFSDIVQLVRLTKTLDFADPDRMFARGGSQGGALTVACSALCGDDIKACAPMYPYLSDYKRVYEMDLAEDAYKDLKDFIRKVIPEDGEREEFWKTLGYIDIQNMTKRIKANVYWFTGLMDKTCPASTQFAAYNKITSNKKMYIASLYGHESERNWRDKEFQFFIDELEACSR